jgi:hypothetical protein
MTLLGFTVSCGHMGALPVLDPVTDRALLEKCGRPHVGMSYRYVHAIEALLPGGKSATMIGVTLVDPSRSRLHSVLMTLEGLVLFDGESSGAALHVSRAVGPFAGEAFGRHMMDDVRLLFLAPENPVLEAGMGQDGSILCRGVGHNGESVHIRLHPDQTWNMETFTGSLRRLREVMATNLIDGIPGNIELKAHAHGRYVLRLRLIGAEPAEIPKQRRLPSVNDGALRHNRKAVPLKGEQ